VRRVCKVCGTDGLAEKDPHWKDVQALGVELQFVRRGKGCEACRGTGFKGRVGIFEMIKVDDGLRELAMEASR
jgi:type II secretory ATPase GspE/PulE/Tfp pilus assembly ATPase PilB-like protein